MANPPPPDRTTNTIISLILSLYTKNRENLHLRFNHKCISLKAFLHQIIPCIAKMNWPLQKDDISRAWHSIYIIHEDFENAAMEFALPPPISGCRSDQVLLDPRFVFQTVMNANGRVAPNLATLHFEMETGFQLAPKAEVRVSTFLATWFISQDPYVQRFSILKEAANITLFIGKAPHWSGGSRFNLTWLPHTHLNPNVLNRRNNHSWTSVRCPGYKVIKAPQHNTNTSIDLTAIVINVHGCLTSNLLSNFYLLAEHDNPMLVILTGTRKLDGLTSRFAAAMGYEKMIGQDPDDGKCNGVLVFWKKRLIKVEKRPCYEHSMHLMIKVDDGRKRGKGKKIHKMVSCITGRK